MVPSPTWQVAKLYLESALGATSWDDGTIEGAFEAEAAAQAKRCRIPVPSDVDPTPEWPADLAEALFRRVAANLANRALPLGVQANIAEAAISTTRVGGGDREVRRLEAPYRRVSFG